MKTYLANPEKLQLEISSMCNVLCLGCVRTDANNFNDKKHIIPDKVYLDIEIFKKILTAPELGTVNKLEFCGSIDDPLMHPKFLDMLDFAADTGKLYDIIIHTNGSLRNRAYFERLAKICHRHRWHTVKFSVDGLADTNPIYRQGSNFKKIMENAESFIQAGGNAAWQFLIFPWNEHQVMQAKELSVKMGFKEFMSRHDRSITTSLGLDRIQLHKKMNRAGSVHNTNLTMLNERFKDSIENKIACNNQTKKMYFVGYDGRLWPCCFLHNGRITLDDGKRDILNKRMLEVYGDYYWNDCNIHSIKDILNHPFYTNDLVESWDSQYHGLGATDRIHRCTEVCNVKKLEEVPIGNYKIL